MNPESKFEKTLLGAAETPNTKPCEELVRTSYLGLAKIGGAVGPSHKMQHDFGG